MTPTVRHEIVGATNARPRLRIAHLSDLHLWFTDRKLRLIERRVNEWRPDVLALTGDYADTPLGRRLAIAWMERMARTYPLCWVAGNHDRWDGALFLQKLEGLQHAHPIDRRDAWIAGRSGGHFRFTSRERMQAAPAADVVPTVVLLHDPALLDAEKLHGAGHCLLLAGHLHGGQITLWRDREGRRQPAAFCYPWLVDRTQIGATTLIVSGGLGDTLPVRFRAPQEIVMVDFCA